MRWQSRVFPYGYVFIILLALGIGYLDVIDPRLGYVVRLEDHLLENLTAAFLLLAALALLAVAVRPQPWFPTRALYLLTAAGFLFLAGEEISFGQRLLGFASPEFFAVSNDEGEVNLHNLSFKNHPALIRFIHAIINFRWLPTIALLLCLAVMAAYFQGKDKFCGIPLPSPPLLFGFLVTLGYLYEGDFGLILYSGAHTPLLLWLVYAWLGRQGQLLFLGLAALVSLEAALYVNFDLVSTADNFGERFEFLAAACCLAYPLELLGHAYSGGGREARPPRPAPGRRRFPIPAWLLAGAFIIVASLSMAGLGYLKVRIEIAQAAAGWQAVVNGEAGEPFGKSETGLEVYRSGRRLVYTGTNRHCQAWETQPPVFLHLTPANPADLPEAYREYGYENRDFEFKRRERYRPGSGRCVATVPLPDYPIAEIRTGQYEYFGERLWEGRLQLETGEYQAAYAAATANPPALRSAFDVYLYGNAVTYIKEPCAAADIAGMFILHPYPANPGDLPEGRRGQEFDNLDFQFDLRGARFDGKCVASVPLPDYPIDRLRVGQWLPEENRQLWQGEIPVGR